VARLRGQAARKWRHRSDPKSPEEAEMVHLINTAPALVQNSTLAHFLSNDYKAVYFYYRHLNMLVLLALGITVVFFASVATKGTAMLKFFITFIAVTAVVAAMVYESPFLNHEKWKENVKVYSLVLAVTSGLLNYVTFAEGELQEFPMGRSGSRNMSLLVFAMSIGLFFILVTSFWRVLVRGAEAEAKAQTRRKRRLQRLVVDLPHERHVSYYAGGNPLVYKTLQDHEASIVSSGAEARHANDCRGNSSSVPAPTSVMSRLAKKMLRSGRLPSVAAESAAAQQTGDHVSSGPLRRRSLQANASWDERRVSVLSSALVGPHRTRARRQELGTATRKPSQASGDKWRKAYAIANAELGVMSAKERQQILRNAARERAYTKRALW
jgi:hypothetical protein